MGPRRHLFVLLLLAACSSSTPHPVAQPTPSTPPPNTPAPSSPTPGNEDPLAPRPALESPAPTGQPTCDPARLSVVDADAVVGRTWTEVFALRTTGAPCQLRGWPVVRLLDGQGRTMPVTYRRTGAPSVVTLSRGTSLSFELTTARTGSCPAAARLEVTLPGTTTPLTTPTALAVCGGRIEVSPVIRRADSEDATG